MSGAIICGLSLGEAQRPTAMGLVAVRPLGEDPKDLQFDLVELYRFSPRATVPQIADAIAADLKLDRLREKWLALQASSFDGAKVSLVIDATLTGSDAFAEFERVKRSGALALDHFIGLKLTNAAFPGEPEWRQGAQWFRLPLTELVTAMNVKAIRPGRFRVLPSIEGRMAQRFAQELREFKGRTGGTEVLAETRTRPDDDLLLAVTSAVWWGSRPKPTFILESWAPPQREWRPSGPEDWNALSFMRLKYGGGGRKY
jgi:hypothetical protein